MVLSNVLRVRGEAWPAEDQAAQRVPASEQVLARETDSVRSGLQELAPQGLRRMSLTRDEAKALAEEMTREVGS